MPYKTRRTKVMSKTAYRKWGFNIAIPWISFAGIWIGDAGFKDGDTCEIKVSKNKLIIIKV